MTAKIIAVANQKGGCGKTTITMQLAGTYAAAGHKVLVVDADPQGTATRWAASAPDDKAFPARLAGLSAAGGKVHREVQKLAPDYDLLIIDCPPAVDSPVPQSALMVADLVLVPVIPSPPDIWAAVGIRELVQRISDVNEGLKARLVANMCQPATTLTKESLDLLKDFGIPLAESFLCLRTAYRQSAVFGTTVHGMKDPKSVAEVEMLAAEVAKIVGFNVNGSNRNNDKGAA